MGLTAGQRLGPYAIVAPLGAGGMGEVYRATDTKLGREVNALYVSPFPGMGTRVLVARGGEAPRWSDATHELFYIRDDELMVAPYVVRDRSFEMEPPRALFRVPALPTSSVPFDVAPDGKRLLFFAPLEGEAMGDEVHVETNGFRELQQAAAEEP